MVCLHFCAESSLIQQKLKRKLSLCIISSPNNSSWGFNFGTKLVKNAEISVAIINELLLLLFQLYC